MKWTILTIVAVVLLICFTGLEGPFVLMFGWISYLADVLPRMTVDEPSLAMGALALVLFTGGVHVAGRAWRRRSDAEATSVSPWKMRWSLAITATVFLLFAAGVSMVATAHQCIWLFTSDRPVLVPGPSYSGSATVRRNNNLRFMALAVHASQDIWKELPGGRFGPDGSLLRSWETDILVGLNYAFPGGLDRAKPWNDPVNQKYFKCIIPEFLNPALAGAEVINEAGYGLNHYSANEHVLDPRRKIKKITDIKDGTSNTLLFGEIVAHFRPWPVPGNWRDPAIGLNRHSNGFGGPDGNGAVFALADGSVRFLSDRVSPDVLRALATPAGGETVREQDWSR